MIPSLPPHNPIHEAVPQLSEHVALRAESALICARSSGQKVEKFVIFDAARPATERRLYVIDVSQSSPRLLLTDWVAHGSGSDRDNDGIAERFSNAPNSNATSLGLYRIAERYQGKHGWSFRLDGLTPGLNDNARDRAVVMHASSYVTPGHVGRSWGCPAVRPQVMQELDKLGMRDTMLWIDAEGQGLDSVAVSCSAAEIFAAQFNQVDNPFAPRFAMSLANNADPYALTCKV